MSVEVFLTADAREAMNDLPMPILRRVNVILERLRSWPAVSGAKPLTGDLAGHYRIRTGDYRVQFHFAAGRIIVEKIGHRDRFYD